VNLGARPLFVDIEEAGFNMDPGCLLSFLKDECSFNRTAGGWFTRLEPGGSRNPAGTSLRPVCRHA